MRKGFWTSLSIVKMGKLTILGLTRDREAVLDALMRSGAVELIDEKKEEAFAGMDLVDNLDMRVRLQRTISDLQKRFPELGRLSGKKLTVSEEDFLFSPSEEEAMRALVQRYEDLVSREEDLNQAIHQLEQEEAQLQPWGRIPLDLSVRETGKTRLIYGTFADQASALAFERDLGRDFPLTAVYYLEEEDLFPAKVLIITIKDQAGLVRARLSSSHFHEIPDLPLTGTARASLEALRENLAARERDLLDLEEEMGDLAGQLARLMTYHDYLLVRADRKEADRLIHDSTYTFRLTAWVPADQAHQLARDLADRYEVAWTCRDALEDEETPVKLKNNIFVRAFEVVLEMYGAPSSQEVDPMPVMAPFYMILFGMMLSDVGYGAMLMAGTAYMLFGRKVEGNSRQMSMMLFISGISSVIWGFIFGGFFGDMLTAVTQGRVNFPALWFNPMDSPVQLLVFSMLFGVIHLFFGLGLHIINEKRQGNLIGGLADSVTWYLIIPGLGLMLGAGSFSDRPETVALLGQVGQWLVIGGAAFGLIFAGHGIKNPFKRLIKGLGALYGITSYLSDILSYARILALVLATSVIATVVNMLGMLAGPSVFGYIVFALIGAFGHTLNLALSALSAFVHTSRLQYVELFGKFFVGGGSFWNPFRRKTSYVRIREGEGEAPATVKAGGDTE